MDILERLLLHDAWTTKQLLLIARDLSDEQVDREFDIGHLSLRRTLVHIVGNMECWYDMMSSQPVRRPILPLRGEPSISSVISRLDRVSPDLLALGRRVVAENRLNDRFIDVLETPPTRKSYGGALVHVATHGMHHRAHCFYIMRRLGITNLTEGDALSWECMVERTFR